MVLKPSGAAIVTPAKPGVGFDPDEALRVITRAALAERSQVSLRTVPTEAAIPTAAARRAKARVAQLLSAPIAFTRRGQPAGHWPIRRLAPLLTATTYKHVIGVKFDPVKVGAALRPPLADYTAPAPATRAGRSSGSKARVLSSLSGIDLDARTTARHMTRAGGQDGPARTAALAFRVTQPELTTAAARALGATSVVSEATTSLGDSSANRVFNVALLAQLLDGAIVKPGATFSFNATRRQAHRRARLQGGPGDRERRARAVDRRRRLPGGDDGLRRRVLRRLRDLAPRQPLVLHLALPARARRHGGRLRPRLHVRQRHAERDRDQGDGEPRDDDRRFLSRPLDRHVEKADVGADRTS